MKTTCPANGRVVVLTHRFWTRRLGADPGVLDRPLRLNNREFAVVGVAEPGFEGVTLAGTDLFVPMAMVAEARGLASAAQLTDVRGVWHMGVGRLRPGLSQATAAAELNTLMAQFKAANPAANPRHTVALVPTSRVPGPMRTPFLVFVGVLFVLTGALLAIACSNVAGMLLARATARRREMATRLAVGASRGRLVGQLLTETALLFLIGGVIAVPLTVVGVQPINASLPALPIALNVVLAVNGRVVAFALGVSLATALVFGLAPARHALGHDLAPLLHGAAATADRRRLWLRHLLVVAQVALSLMLVVTAGLFVRTLQAAAATDPGFTTTDVTLANLDVSLSGFRGPAAVDLVQRLQARVAGLPGVTAVAAARMIPLQGSGFSLGRLRVPGYLGPAGDDTVDADWNVVTPEYFDVVRMRIVDGRGLGDADRDGATRVAVVNETFARTVWPGRSAVGQRLLHQGRDDVETSARSGGSRRRRQVPLHQRCPRAVPVRADGAAPDRRRHAVCRPRPGSRARRRAAGRRGPGGAERAGDVRAVLRRRRGHRPDAAATHRLGGRQRRRGRRRSGRARSLRADGIPGGAADPRTRHPPRARRVAASTAGRSCSGRPARLGAAGAAVGLLLAAGVGTLLRVAAGRRRRGRRAERGRRGPAFPRRCWPRPVGPPPGGPPRPIPHARFGRSSGDVERQGGGERPSVHHRGQSGPVQNE